MKQVSYGISLVVLAMFLAGSAVFAMQHEASVDKGKALFNDPKLGTNGKTCNDCHKDGTGLEQAGARPDIDKTVNSCIKSSLKGKALKTKSVEMQSLVLFLKSLGGEKKSDVKKTETKKAPVGC